MKGTIQNIPGVCELLGQECQSRHRGLPVASSPDPVESSQGQLNDGVHTTLDTVQGCVASATTPRSTVRSG
ncbi:hypothetical protein M378DRAFT_165050 [Amanita muscaria Koide BX008]|uniref:Uncharacterized protein n=1 Tax=Amanita muscaria (strain Koide BX008) TaxID=946122 RepID=A0A0C2X1F5_AMAMK|nr:hypothetical protein M378DRAFT_165050 [Amanita muscaria Koide BX008]